ncbi:MAG: hypothetical protein JW941_10050 [Candidatus Coatesbacteria bacterium]|nr:hypothetical protein [Candidatus Coatesbacteria bacterium]
MKSTEYFLHVRSRADRESIKDDWIIDTIEHPIRTDIQSDGRIRKWGYVKDAGKYLRVILLNDGETVHNAFFDRSFRERQQ